MMKWSGTYIKMHPFYKIPFSSTFKLYLETLTKVKSIKITQLTYYTSDAVKSYQQNYLQKEMSFQQQKVKQDNFIKFLLYNYISLPEDDKDKQKSLEMLQNIVQTGDSIFIGLIIENLRQMLESQITGYQSVIIIHNLVKVKQIQFLTLVRDQLLCSLGYYTLMMSKEKFSQLEYIDLNYVLKLVCVWKRIAMKMGLQFKTFDQFFNKMKQQKVYSNSNEFSSEIESIEQDVQNYKYYLSLQKLQKINIQKKTHLNLKDNQNSIKKITKLKYKMRNDFNKLMFSNDNINNISNNSIKKDNNSFNLQNSFNLHNSFNKKDNLHSGINEPVQQKSQQNSSYSPIKQLKMSNVDKSIQENNRPLNNSKEQYIRFKNSLDDLSQQKQKMLGSQQKLRGNIYTSKQQYQDKKSFLSRSNLSNKSSKSKRSLGKLQKASSFGFGLQKVKSSKMIGYSQNSQYNQSNNKSNNFQKNQNKINLIKFDDSYTPINQKHGNSKYGHSMSSDNNPYKDQFSNSLNSHHHSNNNKTKNQSSSSYRKLLKNQQVILVQETVKKPKFGFAKNNDSQTSNNSLTQLNNLKQSPHSNLDEQTETDQSLKIDPQLVSQDKFSKYSSIPSDFNVAFKSNKKNKQNSRDSDSNSKLNIKFNKFPHKLKQIQLQIQKAKQFQLLYQEKMKQKDQQFQSLQKNLPQTHQKVYQENQRLKSQLQQKLKEETQKLALKDKRSFKSPNKKIKEQIPFLSNKIFSLGKLIPFETEFRKQMISNKCLIEKNDIFQLGYAFKKENIQQLTSKRVSYSISFYFKFKLGCERFKIKLMKGSLNVDQLIDTSIENIVANKQLKFQQKITGYTLFNNEFIIPNLQVQTKIDQKLLTSINQKKNKIKQNLCSQNYKIQVPCSLFNFLDFHTPNTKIQFIKTKYAIQAQFSTPQYCQSLQGQFLLNCFKCGKWHENQEGDGGFYVSFYTYIKDIKEKRKNDPGNFTVNFQELGFLQRKQVNLYIRKLNQIMFYIESDNQFEADKVVLSQISKVLAR